MKSSNFKVLKLDTIHKREKKKKKLSGVAYVNNYNVKTRPEDAQDRNTAQLRIISAINSGRKHRKRNG